MDITVHASTLPHDDPDASWPSIATPSASWLAGEAAIPRATISIQETR